VNMMDGSFEKTITVTSEVLPSRLMTSGKIESFQPLKGVVEPSSGARFNYWKDVLNFRNERNTLLPKIACGWPGSEVRISK
jgi:hypothetical protein